MTARAPLTPLAVPTLFKARDEFDQPAGELNGKALPDGTGNWATTGGAEDFKTTGSGKVKRTKTIENAARIATAPAAKTSLLVERVTFEWSALPTEGGQQLESGVGLLYAYYDHPNGYLRLYTGVGAGYEWLPFPFQANTPYTLTYLFKGGVFSAGWITTNGAFPAGSPNVISPSTAGITETQAQFSDRWQGAGAVTRYYDNFATWVPNMGVVTCSGRKTEFNTDQAELSDAAGNYWGPVPFARGGRFYIPCSGEENWVSRLAVRARRNDIEVEKDANVTDKQTLEVKIRERFLVPR